MPFGRIPVIILYRNASIYCNCERINSSRPDAFFFNNASGISNGFRRKSGSDKSKYCPLKRCVIPFISFCGSIKKISSVLLISVCPISVILSNIDFPEPVWPKITPLLFLRVFLSPIIGFFVFLLTPYQVPPG